MGLGRCICLDGTKKPGKIIGGDVNTMYISRIGKMVLFEELPRWEQILYAAIGIIYHSVFVFFIVKYLLWR
jgi:hypothetical protein